MNCKYCNKQCKNKNSLRQHEIRCKMNPNKLEISSKFNNSGRKGANQHTTAKKRGESVAMSAETRAKLSKSATEQNLTRWTEDARKRHSDIMKQVVLDNPESYSKSNVSGRVLMYEFEGQVFKGTWELEVAKSLSASKIEYTNEITPIPYMFDGNEHLYFPDFYIPQYDVYIEVKGYERDRDLAKYKSLENLIVLKEAEIKRIIKGDSITEWLFEE